MNLPPLQRAALPPFPGLWRMLGPGLIWLALAQGSGELIWWPYIIAKYGLAFLCLLAPACFLQYPVNYHLGYYTMTTGEGIFHGFARLNKTFAFLLWALMVLSFLWFGAFASAGGTALAALTQFPAGWSDRARSLFWGYASMFVYLIALVRSRFVYRLIERFMTAVALITVVGLVWACSTATIRAQVPAFLQGLLRPSWPAGRIWDPTDATKLLTAITFAGLGGFWTLFYPYWLRAKGAGMVTTGGGQAPEDSAATRERWPHWRRYLVWESGIGVVGNLVTTLMTCLLAYALLFPTGTVPEKFELAVVQSRFFEVSWGAFGRILFLLVAAAFLSDTWMATVDTVARIHAECTRLFFPAANRRDEGWWYRRWLWILTGLTAVTMAGQEPGPLILLSAVIGFVGTVLFTIALFVLNVKHLVPQLPDTCWPRATATVSLLVAIAAYLALAVAYLLVQTRLL